MKTPVRYVAIAIASLSLVMFTNLDNVNADTPEESSGFGQAASAMNPLNWKMPELKMPNFKSLLPSKAEQTQIDEKKDGLFDQVGKTASNSWTKTKTALSPKNLNPARFFTTSSKSAVKQVPTKEKKPGFWGKLLSPWPEEEPEQTTVTDFLRQPRVGR
ncbi:hypothetical protein OAF37_03935 [Rubripirellula sp.]|jgi:hypothetical protein|nr:hypothetical protein [Rubripirellula sp.]MDA7907089.1 hypothetical protein [bacterium]MDB4645188.1 hypothetical protein [Rubripirellula sp.]